MLRADRTVIKRTRKLVPSAQARKLAPSMSAQDCKEQRVQEQLAADATRFISENIKNLTRKVFMHVALTRSEGVVNMQIYPGVFGLFQEAKEICCRSVIGLPDPEEARSVPYDTVYVSKEICDDRFFQENKSAIDSIVSNTCTGIIHTIHELGIADRSAMFFLVDRFANCCIFKLQKLYGKCCPMHIPTESMPFE